MRVWLIVLGIWAIQAQAATIEQTTAGWCSPAVGQANTVTIVCQGVDPKALARLNELLDKKDFELQAKIREAEEWAQKYRDVQQRLAEEGRDDVLARQARGRLEEGKLEEAGAVLDRLLASGDRIVEQVAADHFKRAEVYTLQWQPENALPHYEHAYRYRPNDVEYALHYATALLQQESYAQAQTVYQSSLTMCRQLAEKNPQTYLPYVANALHNLGVLYSLTQQLSDGEQAFHEALTIQRQLAETNPQTHLPGMASVLHSLGTLYSQTQRLSDSEQAWREALTIWRQLAEKTLQAYLPDVTRVLQSL